MDIVVQNIAKRYGDDVVLDGFSATFRRGSVTCIMGPSGCGKTTLLNLLMGLEKPDAGTIRGVPVLKSAVFQEDRLCEEFTALTNVAMVLDSRFDRSIIRSHLEDIGLQDDPLKPVRDYSGGMKRRVALVRAVMAPSDVLFMDEPLKGLDDRTKGQVVHYLKQQFGDRTVIMVTHDKSEIDHFGAEVITLEEICKESGV